MLRSYRGLAYWLFWGLFLVSLQAIQSANAQAWLTDAERLWIAQHPTITIGTRIDNGPAIITSGDKLEGIIPDIIQRLEIETGLKITLEPKSISYPLSNEELIGLDGFALISSQGVNSISEFSISQPVLQSLTTVFARSEDLGRIAKPEDLLGSRIVYRIHDKTIPEILWSQPDKLIRVQSEMEGFTALLEQKADFFIGVSLDNFNLSSFMIPDIDIAHIMQEGVINAGFAIRNQSPELLSIFNKAIDRIGPHFFIETTRRWIKLNNLPAPDQEIFTEAEQRWLKNHQQIQLGFSLLAPPWLIKENDQYSGILFDIAQELSKITGIHVKVIDDSWSSLLERARKRDIDGILLAPTEYSELSGLVSVGPPFYTSRALYTRTDKGLSISEPGDLRGKRVLYYSALFYQSQIVKPVIDEITAIKVEGPIDGLSKLLNDEGDVLFGSSTENYLIISNNVPNIKPVYLQKTPAKGRLAVRNDSPLLASILNKAFNKLGSQRFLQIQYSWLGVSNVVTGKLSEQERAYISQLGKLRYDHRALFPPISFMDQQGRPAGIVVDYIKLIADKLDLEIEPVLSYDSRHALDPLLNGSVDLSLILQNLPKRNKELAFSQPYLSIPYSYIAKKDVAIIKSIDDLYGKTIGVTKDSLANHYLATQYPDKIKLKFYKDPADGFPDVKDGVIDGFIENEIYMDYKRRSMQGGELKFAGSLPFSYSPTITVPKHLSELIPIMNRILAEISDREKELIYRRWTNFPVSNQTDWTQLAGWIAALSTMIVAIMTTILYWNRKLSAARIEAEHANQAKSLFLANMSHEIRTPMNAILGFAEIMQQDHALSSTHKHSLEVIHNAGNHLLSLINDILDISKIEAGRVAISSIPCEIQTLLKSLEQMFQISAHSKGLELTFYGIESLPKVLVTDEGKLRQILINLIGNAVKFTQRGYIHCHCEHQLLDNDQLKICIKVKDTGPGIEEADAEKVFSSFEQTKTGIKTEGGTGLGMAISKAYAQLMGGDILLESVTGKGSQFTFSFIGQIALILEESNTNLNGSQIKVRGNDLTILVVDDKTNNRVLVKGMLEPLGFTIAEATNGREAILQYRQLRPDLIIMDIRMPEMDGIQAARLIRQLDNQIPIMAMTAGVFDKDRNTAGNPDFSASLDKPFKRADLIVNIADLLNLDISYEETAKDKTITPLPFEAVSDKGRHKILIVDDVPVNRLLLDKLLTPKGYNCMQCNNGREALEIIKTWHPDLVLLDIQMPVMDGYEVLTTLQESTDLQLPTVVAVTAEYSSAEEQKLLSMGAAAVCSKPVTLQKIEAILDTVLSNE